ncbi:hypothetical protein [Nonomuraea dietziae]
MVLQAGGMLGRSDENAVVMAFVVAAVLAAQALHGRMLARRKYAHARIAGLAAARLQYAAELLGARPRARADHAAARRPELQQALRSTVAGRADAEAILRGPEWPALAGLLRRIAQLGHDPATVVAEVVSWRPLRDDPKSPARRDAQVIMWRLESWMAGQVRVPAAERSAVRAAARPAAGSPRRPSTFAPDAFLEPSRLRELVRTAVRGHVDVDLLVNDQSWPRLAAVLTEIGWAGHDVERALRTVVTERPLRRDPTSPSRSDAQVLTWRLRRWLEEVPAAPDTHRAQRRSSRLVTEPNATADAGAVAASAAEQTIIRPGDDRVFQRAVVAVVESQTCSPERLERALWVRPDKAKDLVRLLGERGIVVAGGDGGYRVLVGVDHLPALREALAERSSRAAQLSSSTARSRPTRTDKPAPSSPPGEAPPMRRRPGAR